MLDEPGSDLISSLLVMNFSGDERTLRREKTITATKNFMLAALYINLDQLRYWSAVRDEIVQRDGRNINQGSASENRALSVCLHSTMCPLVSSAPEGNTIGGIGPHCGTNNLKSAC